MGMTIQDDLRSVLNEGAGHGTLSWADTSKAVLADVQAVINSTNDLRAQVANLTDAVAKLQLGGVDPVAVAQAIAAHVKLAPQ